MVETLLNLGGITAISLFAGLGIGGWCALTLMDRVDAWRHGRRR